jgi:hypothetical protein
VARAALADFTAADSAVAGSTVASAGDVNRHMKRNEGKGTRMLCNRTEYIGKRKTSAAWVVVLALSAFPWAGLPCWGQQGTSSGAGSPTEPPKAKAFPKPEDAAAAIYAAAKRNDEAEMMVILGPDGKGIVEFSDDPGELREQREMFAQKYEAMHRLVKEPDNTIALYVGSENWPLPIPLVRFQGAWYFDADLGRQEILYRRIGNNEMEAMEVCRTLVDAEKEYRATSHQYTDKFISRGDSHDGLYWPSADDAGKSPIGPYLAHAGVSGGADTTQSRPFHGYYYRVQLGGSDGFRVIAFPAEYRSSGVMTFLVNQDGKAFEKDLGDQTATLSNQVASPDADKSWKPLE